MFRQRANATQAENRLPGSDDWRMGANGSRPVDDATGQVMLYASVTSVNVGDAIGFHLSAAQAEGVTIAIHRLGHYGGAGARHMMTSPRLDGRPQAEPDIDPDTGLISCAWPVAWSLTVPVDWTSGYYVAIATTETGWRSSTPFVVREDQRSADLCVIIPFSTYQAYNQWPLDGSRGKSLYYGYEAATGLQRSYPNRAYRVSFDRPYSGDGVPFMADLDHDFLRWAEEAGYDVVYASTVDLHNRHLDLTRYGGLVFSGHDEYWTSGMRSRVERFVARGRGLAFMTANNIYWHVRLEAATDGRPDRVVTCYKSDPDPYPDQVGETRQWREKRPGPQNPEQSLIGVLYNGYVAAASPLVVTAADHWVWAGTGVRDGDAIPDIVDGEADGLVPVLPVAAGARQTLLSASPYPRPDGTERVQNTSVYVSKRRAIVFAAGSLTWPRSLGGEKADPRIQAATANVLDRIVRAGRRRIWHRLFGPRR